MSCPVERKKLVRRGTLDLGTGEESNLDAGTWEIEECGTPLFGKDRTIGVCRACLEGWHVERNAPTDKGWTQIEKARKREANA